jgi:hypothetical protein
MMRPFIGWPTWALRALISALVLTSLFPRMLHDAERELWRRDAGAETDGICGWWCVAPGGIN